jgi:hypothetical protein
MFARWTRVANPAGRQLDQPIRHKHGQPRREHALLGQLALPAPVPESEVTRFEQDRFSRRATEEAFP